MPDEQSDELEVKTPAGSIRTRGTDVIATLAAICVAIGTYILYEHQRETRDAQKEVVSAVQKVAEGQAELSYMLSLTPEERSRLNLEMPASLRRRLTQ